MRRFGSKVKSGLGTVDGSSEISISRSSEDMVLLKEREINLSTNMKTYLFKTQKSDEKNPQVERTCSLAVARQAQLVGASASLSLIQLRNDVGW